MEYKNTRIAEVAKLLKKRLPGQADKSVVLRAPELKALYAEIPSLKLEERAPFGKEINQLKAELENLVSEHAEAAEKLTPIDVTAPFDVNTPADKPPRLLSSESGSTHPLMKELEKVLDIFARSEERR